MAVTLLQKLDKRNKSWYTDVFTSTRGLTMKKYERICGQGIRVAVEFTPTTYGKLTTLGPKFLLQSEKAQAYQVCQCECGEVRLVWYNNLRNGHTRACARCLKDPYRSRQGKVQFHPRAYPREYIIFSSMKGRCLNPKNTYYVRYGGRGIKVCERWLEPDGLGFSNFIADMGARPSPKHSIDRIDNDGDYCPENCRWATATQQARNTRSNVHITARGETHSLAEWAEITGLTAGCIRYRYMRGKREDELFKAPNT